MTLRIAMLKTVEVRGWRDCAVCLACILACLRAILVTGRWDAAWSHRACCRSPAGRQREATL